MLRFVYLFIFLSSVGGETTCVSVRRTSRHERVVFTSDSRDAVNLSLK